MSHMVKYKISFFSSPCTMYIICICLHIFLLSCHIIRSSIGHSINSYCWYTIYMTINLLYQQN